MEDQSITVENSTTTKACEAGSEDRLSPSPGDQTTSRSKSRRTRQPTSGSTKSASGSRLRLSRVLSRYVEFRALEDSDYRYLWAAYKKGAFQRIDEFPPDLGPQEFVSVFLDIAEHRGLAHAWTFLAPSSRGYEPVGFAWAWGRGRVIEIADMVWFPWASSRNVLESAANFFNTMRKTTVEPGKPFLVWEFARLGDKKFFETMCRLGIMRRVGHVHGLYEEPAVMFETRNGR